ncbi:MAG: hypothetical protein LBK73_03835 [Treponema sp.]|nr:hypothetical protein [Treponema sp.]
MSAFHIKDDFPVRTGGDTNMAGANDVTTRMDYMYYLKSGSDSPVIHLVQRVGTWPTVNSPDHFVWAVGGFDLMLSGSYANAAAIKTATDNRFKAAPNGFNGNITELPSVDSSWFPAFAQARHERRSGL